MVGRYPTTFAIKRTSPDEPELQRQALQQGELDADTVRSLQRMLANTQNAVLRLAREIDQLRGG